MEQDKIDIIEPTEFKIEIAEPIEFKTVKQQVATLIVNGQVQKTQEIECIVAKCPNCGETLQQFDSSITLADILRELGEMGEAPEDIRCPHCQMRFSFDKRFVSIQEGVFVE